MPVTLQLCTIFPELLGISVQSILDEVQMVSVTYTEQGRCNLLFLFYEEMHGTGASI
jgi:hypothetical protein